MRVIKFLLFISILFLSSCYIGSYVSNDSVSKYEDKYVVIYQLRDSVTLIYNKWNSSEIKIIDGKAVNNN